MKMYYRLIGAFLLLSLCIFSCKPKEKGPLKDFNGRVLKVTPQILQVQSADGTTIMFDNRKVTYVNGALLPQDSVCVSYRGDLDNGTVAVIAELIYIPKPID